MKTDLKLEPKPVNLTGYSNFKQSSY